MAQTRRDTLTTRRLFSLLVFLAIQNSAFSQQAADPATYANYGAQLASQGKCPEALQYLEYAAAQNSSLPGVWTRIGYCKETAGDKVAAVEAYRKAVAADPNDAYAKGRFDALAPEAVPPPPSLPAAGVPTSEPSAASPDESAPHVVPNQHASKQGPIGKGFGLSFKLGIPTRLFSKEFKTTVESFMQEAIEIGYTLDKNKYPDARGVAFELEAGYWFSKSFSLALRSGVNMYPVLYQISYSGGGPLDGYIRSANDLMEVPFTAMARYHLVGRKVEGYFGGGLGPVLVSFTQTDEYWGYKATGSGMGIQALFQAGMARKLGRKVSTFLELSATTGKVGSVNGNISFDDPYWNSYYTGKSTLWRRTEPNGRVSYLLFPEDILKDTPSPGYSFEKVGLGLGTFRVDVGIRLRF